MKKLATLLLAAGLVFSAATGASAIDFKGKGQWVMNFDYGNATLMEKNRQGKKAYNEDFAASQRVRLQLDAVASEALSGTVFFEIGNQNWGRANQGAALGADGTVVEVRRAYLDWVMPQTDLKIRMGLQGIALPAFTNGSSQVFDADVAGIVASYKFNDNVSSTFFWARPFNDNYTGQAGGVGANTILDNMDIFGLVVPLTFDGVKVTPWVAYAAMGRNVPFGNNTNVQSGGGNNYWNNFTAPGAFPAYAAIKGNAQENAYTSMFFAGLTGEITMADPFRFAWDVNYGSSSTGIQALDRQGWYASLLGEYKMDWATPGLYVWYASGDDSNVKNGSERMPSIAADGVDGFSSFASSGNPYIGRETVLGNQWTGTWGIGARLKDMSFLEDLKHTFRVNYIGGTNSPSMAKYILGKKEVTDARYVGAITQYEDFNATVLGQRPVYLTTMDSALEFGLTTTYKIYDNLTLFSELSYMAMMMDKSDAVWGKGGNNNNSYGSHDPWNINVAFVYDF